MKYEQGHIVHQRFMSNEVNITSVGYNVRRLFACAFVCLILNKAAIRATKDNKSLPEERLFVPRAFYLHGIEGRRKWHRPVT